MLFIAGWLTFNDESATTEGRLTQSVDLLAEHASKVFEMQAILASHINDIIADRTDQDIRHEEEQFRNRIRKFADRLDEIQDIWVIDANGYPLLSANTYPVPLHLNVFGREYFATHKSGQTPKDQPYVSDVLSGLVNQDYRFFNVSWRRTKGLEESAQFTGVISISMEIGYFTKFYQKLLDAGYSTVGLVKADGSVLIRVPSIPGAPVMLNSSTRFRNETARSPEAGSYRATSTADGQVHVVAYRKVAEYPVYVTSSVVHSQIVAAWAGRMAGHMAFGVPATVALLILTLVAMQHARSEGRALRQLSREIEHRAETEQQLRQTQKLEAIGQLTGGIAHDFNNLLQIIVGSLEIITKRLGGSDAKLSRLAEAALGAAGRGAGLVRSLLSFARRQPVDPAVLDANDTLRTISTLLRRALRATIEIEIVLQDELWLCRVDAGMLESAIVNLALNARDAMEADGRLTIATSNVTIDQAYAQRHSDVTPGEYVLITVSDTGHGMSEETLLRAFEPFFTTKPIGEGTGLGLSQVYGFIKQSRGHVQIWSELGKGVVVKLYLPRHQEGAEGAVAEETELLGGLPTADDGEVILLVEDDPGVRAFTRHALIELGYEVVDESDAEAALALIDGGLIPAALVTDVVMPGINGLALARAAQRRLPTLKFLLMTGYSEEAQSDQDDPDMRIPILDKPFTLRQLAEKLRMVIDGSP